MLTVDYTFYAGMFRGSLSEEAFDRLKIPAAAWLDQATFGRVNGPMPAWVEYRAKMALCAVVDAVQINEERGDVAAETNDGVSVTYRAGADGKTEEQRLYGAAAPYLAATGLLYRGCR